MDEFNRPAWEMERALNRYPRIAPVRRSEDPNLNGLHAPHYHCTTMKPGRELDALVAEKVMGWTQCNPLATWDRWEYGDPGDDWTAVGQEWCRGDGVPPGRHQKMPIPRYSTSIADAWLVVQKLQATEHCVYLSALNNGEDEEMRYSCQITNRDGHKGNILATVIGAGMELAICLAALKAVAVQP